jgi:DNA repair photolyase
VDTEHLYRYGWGVRFLPVANPPNPFSSTTLDYELGEVPNAPLQVFEDHTRTILAKNDSPDVGFDWSVNPYRGCFAACAYCLSGDTRILMGDASTRALRDLRRGDYVYGTTFDGKYRRYRRTRVLAHWQTVKPAYRVELEDGTEIVASGDHRFLTERGWKYVTPDQSPAQRPFLTTNNKLLGIGDFGPSPPETADYKRGYLSGMIRGDGCLFASEYRRGERTIRSHSFRLALVDLDGLRRTKAYLREISAERFRERVFQEATPTRKPVFSFGTGKRAAFSAIEDAIAWPADPSVEWQRGFVAGIFDAEGHFSAAGCLRITNTDEEILDRTLSILRRFCFDVVLEEAAGRASNVRVRGGLREHLRFFHLMQPAIARKRDLNGMAFKVPGNLRVRAVTKLGFDLLMYDITTGTGDFIANGVVSHNCYARPTHEYLSFGAGTDWERKIVVKPKAPELLREAFDKKSWKGELVVFSGITDCYQPLEHSFKLTRGCLEVCIEYRNPAGFITKSPVIERDAELLAELARVANCRVSVSIPFWDPVVAKAMEPFVTTPMRRMKIVETLAKAGVPVGVSVSPIVPGLNDQTIPEVLHAAKDAGASHAFFVMLRLPGSVAPVFETALREKLPLRAEKVLRRLREMHGNKLYDSRFGHRGRGEGVYAGTIQTLFTQTAKRLGLVADENKMYDPPTAATFRRPDKTGQMGFEF